MENKYSSKYLIETGIGLQDVDGLKNSLYFLSQADRYVKGEISLDELDKIISSYYENKPNEDERTEEADIVSNRIAQIISDDSFTFTVGQLVSIHKRLFEGVFGHAGKLRDYNFIKKEWVLDGRSVIYGDYHELKNTLEYDFETERNFKYADLSDDKVIEHLATFISNLWQIHAFQEGNTRTTAVFFIKYLRSLGYDITNDVFAKNAWYFDSPVDSKSQYETFVTQELREYVEANFPTINDPAHRAITGLSMGGHGALWLGWRHPEIYGSCGSMSGAVDIMTLKDRFDLDKCLGKYAQNAESWKSHSVMSLVPDLKNGQNIIIDDGAQDFLIKENRALHAALDKKGIKHQYSERPGKHAWNYWVTSLKQHLDYFSKCFK